MPGNNFLRTVTITPTLDTSAYTSGDVLFNPTLVPGACTAVNQPTYLVGLNVFDQDDQAAADMRILVLTDSTSIGTINTAPNIADADGLNILADVLIPSADWHDMGAFKFARIDPGQLPIPVFPKNNTPDIYIAAVTGGTPTQTASGIKVRLWFQDVYPY
jgi:hypothetical protein